MERRYFLVESAEANKLVEEMNEHNKKALEETCAFLEDIGAKEAYRSQYGGRIVGVSFDERPDTNNLYKVVKGERGLYYPRKNTADGRALAKKFESLPSLKDESEIGILEMFDAKQSMLSGMSLHQSCVHAIPDTAIYISIPYHGIPLGELERRKAEGETNTNLNSMIKSAKWVAPEGLTEVKEWEVQKAYDDYNSNLS